MKITKLVIVLIIAGLAPSLWAAAAKMHEIETEVIRMELRITAIEAGVFTRASKIEAEDGDKVIYSSTSEAVTSTEKIPAEIGTKFGVRFNLGGKSRDQGRIKMLYLTPGVVDDKGSRHDKYEILHVIDRSLSDHVMAFEITEAFEQVPGNWTFLVFEENRLLLKQQFELTSPLSTL
ncbi:MAG: DUF3859 domain-containing protein [Sinobacterium sp.]|jgi:hypothetical protein